VIAEVVAAHDVRNRVQRGANSAFLRAVMWEEGVKNGCSRLSCNQTQLRVTLGLN
jgi:hypothetical protein